MRTRRLRHALLLTALVAVLSPTAAAQVPTPESFFGFRMGDDGRLATYPDIVRYFEEVARTSPRVRIVEVGKSTEGRRMIAAVVSAPENISRLSEIQQVNRRLEDPRTVTPDEARRLAAAQKVVVAIGCSIHASEIAATQAANELLHELATFDDEPTRAVLRDVVVLLMPSLNPDGHEIVVDWAQRYKGTPFESGPLPWLYHKYAGHDINRDAFMMNLAENRAIAAFFYGEWHPQVFLAMHQMGANGPRLFVPPNYDPIDPNYDPLIWRTAALLGSAMAYALESKGRAGVVSNALYDYYWPGYEDSTPLGHNTVCLLTEAASARLALPAEVDPKRLAGSSHGLPAYAPQINFPNPWAGGTWRLRDIVEYELDAVRGLLGGASRYRRELVEQFYEMGRKAVETGRKGSPFAFIVPRDQVDPWATARLLKVLVDGRVEVHQAAEAFRVADTAYPAGTWLVLMGQPYRAYAKTLLERQVYPVRRLDPASPPERPYDVAGWTLGAQMGVRVDRIEQPFEPPMLTRVERSEIPPGHVWGEKRPAYYLVDARGTAGVLVVNRLLAARQTLSWTSQAININGYRYAPGTLLVAAGRTTPTVVEKIVVGLGLRADGVKGRLPAGLRPQGPARVGLYKPWQASIDEGWTRLIFEQYEMPFQNVADAKIRKGGLRASFDVIVLPDAGPKQLTDGNAAGSVPPEYVGGLGRDGIAAMRAFVEEGGTLVCLDSSSALAIEALGLPVKDVLAGLKPEQFFCPGSLVRLMVDTTQPLSSGLPAETAGFFAFGLAFETTGPQAEGRVSIPVRYAPENVLVSGWLEGEKAIAGRAAVVEAKAGLGRAVLIGFRAQHRDQSLATFRLLFNAIYTASTGKLPGK